MVATACRISGEQFNVSDFEIELRQKLQAPPPQQHPRYTFRHLLAFWQHFAVHRRKCDYSGEDIVSVFREDCPYPVWDRKIWIEKADPPAATFDFSQPFFEQLWNLFQLSPSPHNVGLMNENCDYTDDWWHSRNCYLCHSGVGCEDCRYCYRTVNCKDCQFSVFTKDSELCTDAVNCFNCMNVLFAINCRNCRDSAFLFDCRNCNDCLFCWNLRHKEYCYKNKQLSPEEFKEVKRRYDLRSTEVYEGLKQRFTGIVEDEAYWKAFEMEKTVNSTGSYLDNAKNCVNSYFASDLEDCAQFIRGGLRLKTALECVCCFAAERVYHSVLVQDNCYDARYSYHSAHSNFLEYCGFCFNCKNCFGCCGLVGREYCILNQEYSPNEYEKLVTKFRQKVKEEGLEGMFFPGYFAPNPYDESLAAFYFPLSVEEQAQLGFRVGGPVERKNAQHLSVNELPDHLNEVDESVFGKVFWDDIAGRPFQIHKLDLEFARKNSTPLHNCFYIRRIKELFSWLFFNGELRKTRCALTGKTTLTNLPERLDSRIICEEAYLDRFV